MTNYFTIKELCASTTAESRGINNTPSPQIKENLNKLIEFLNPLREAWGSPIRISSGYRCPELNSAIGGSATSAHMLGFAADLVPIGKSMSEFKKFCSEYLKDKNFDQCLLEKSRNAEWVHIGLYNNAKQQRKQIRNMYV